MINENFMYLGIALSLIGYLNYIIDTIRGKTMPNRITWFMWMLAPLIAFGAELDKGVGIQSLMTFMVGFGPLLVFTVSFLNKKSVWKLSLFDFLCGALSVLGLLLWFFTKEGNIAIIFSISADGLAAIPTIVKSFKAPETESYFVYFTSAVSAIITLLTLKNWTLAHYGFPVYIFLICAAFVLLIKFKLGKKLLLFFSKT